MPYSLHDQDRIRTIKKIAEIIADVPDAELSALLAAATNKQKMSRQDCSEPAQTLLSKMRSAISDNSPREAFSLFGLATKDNPGILLLYRNPRDNAERTLSEQIYQVLVDLAKALMLANPVPEVISDEMTADALDECIDCLMLLGGNVPSDLIELFGSILDRCKTESGETPQYITWRTARFMERHLYPS